MRQKQTHRHGEQVSSCHNTVNQLFSNKINFKKLTKNIKVPTKTHSGSSPSLKAK